MGCFVPLVCSKKEGRRLSATLFTFMSNIRPHPTPNLPSRAGSEADTHATRTDSNPDGRAIIVIATIVISAAFDVTLTRSIVVTVAISLLNNDASTATGAVAAAIFIAE